MLFKSKKMKELEQQLAIAQDDTKKFKDLYHDYRDKANTLRGQLDNSYLINNQLRDEISTLQNEVDRLETRHKKDMEMLAKAVEVAITAKVIIDAHEKRQKTIEELDFPNT